MVDAQIFRYPLQEPNAGALHRKFREGSCSLRARAAGTYLKTPEGHIVFDTLAIAETLAEAHPSAALLPKDPAQRGAVRSLVAQMHSAFSALRTHCPMNLQNAWQEFEVQDDLHADLAYLETLWYHAFNMSRDHDWLFGAYSLADVFFAPVCSANCVLQTARFATRAKLCGQKFSTSRFPAMACYGTDQTLRSISLRQSLRPCTLAQPTGH